MTKPGFKVITMREEVYNRIYSVYEKRKEKFSSLSSWFGNYVVDVIEADEMLAKHMPYLQLFGEPYDDTIEIIDRFHGNNIYTVQIKEQRLYCIKDDRDDCIHVGACFAIRKTAQVLKEHGFKPSKTTANKKDVLEK